jgi:hypothetical protein
VRQCERNLIIPVAIPPAFPQPQLKKLFQSYVYRICIHLRLMYSKPLDPSARNQSLVSEGSGSSAEHAALRSFLVFLDSSSSSYNQKHMAGMIEERRAWLTTASVASV